MIQGLRTQGKQVTSKGKAKTFRKDSGEKRSALEPSVI